MRHRVGRSRCYRGAASRGRRGQDPCPAAAAVSARARSSAASRGAGGDRRHHFTSARRRARSLRNRARHGRVAVIRPPRLRGRTHDRPGATLSYGEISTRLGARDLAREVGQALGRNPFPIIVPCHRVLAAGGKAGGFSANGGITTKLRLLTIERARTSDTPTLFDGDSAFGFAMRPRRRNSR